MPAESADRSDRLSPKGIADPSGLGTIRQWPLRVACCLFGALCLLFGLFSLLGAAPDLPELNRDRALGLGLAATVIGAVAIAGSLLTRDVRRLWYCQPRRWRIYRGDL